MIGQLRGVVVERGLDGVCIVDVQGVGYEVFVPLGALGKLPQPPEEATFYVHTHVREDAMQLFAFASADDKSAFRALLTVNSVGPKLALGILSQMTAGQLAQAIAAEDRAVFKGVSGVGKKTAERLILDLKDKLDRIAPSGMPAMTIAQAAPTKAIKVPSGPLATVASALVQMGYKPAQAEAAVDTLKDEADNETVEVLLRKALKVLT